MGKLISAAIAALVIFSLLDQHFYSGRHPDAMIVVLRQIHRSFG
jgi:hypothetical protein